MKSNLDLLRELKREYNPLNAFGNPVLIDIIKNIKEPNKDGFYETEADEMEKIIKISWWCVNCGRWNDQEVENWRSDTELKEKCSCGAKHIIKF